MMNLTRNWLNHIRRVIPQYENIVTNTIKFTQCGPNYHVASCRPHRTAAAAASAASQFHSTTLRMTAAAATVATISSSSGHSVGHVRCMSSQVRNTETKSPNIMSPKHESEDKSVSMGLTPQEVMKLHSTNLNSATMGDLFGESDKTVIESYNARSFTVNGIKMHGGILAFPNFCTLWLPARMEDITVETLQLVTTVNPEIGMHSMMCACMHACVYIYIRVCVLCVCVCVCNQLWEGWSCNSWDDSDSLTLTL
jgi:hypothetical protein